MPGSRSFGYCSNEQFSVVDEAYSNLEMSLLRSRRAVISGHENDDGNSPTTVLVMTSDRVLQVHLSTRSRPLNMYTDR